MPRTIETYGAALRRGAVTAEATTREYLRRIAAQNDKLGAYTYVAHDQALAAARAIDALLRAGTDLGPLMGAPVAIKDLYYVDGMPPPTAGSKLAVADIVQGEGPFVRALKRSGCVILGKTWTSEFALGGINFVHRVPWNPCDPAVHRTPGGSSGGSGVAQAAGLCMFAIGSDTGGSVRMPAALCGTFGHKFSTGAFPLDGIFPLSPTLDSIGTFTADAADAATIWTALTGIAGSPIPRVSGLKLAKPSQLYYDDLDPEVARRVDAALSALTDAGCEIDTVDLPELDEFEAVFGSIVPIELIGILGRERIERGMGVLDPVVQSRLGGSPDFSAERYLAARSRMDVLRASVTARTSAFDAWITPTTPLLPGRLADYSALDAALAWNRRALRNTRPGNIFDQCAVSIPLAADDPSGLPVGLQIACTRGHDARLLGIALAVERALRR